MDDGELTKELCEDMQDAFDFTPESIQDCCACDEAKYEVRVMKPSMRCVR